MAKQARTYFLTAYVEYLLDSGIRSEEYYLGDASRYLRFLLARTTASDIDAFVATAARSPAYRNRLRKTLRRFYRFARERLGTPVDPFGECGEPAEQSERPVRRRAR
ncbi:MAG: hypothetical protein H0Z37_08715 [Firmicutes bacterium]|nr:hypothetical protein [Bacillota bacterium]